MEQDWPVSATAAVPSCRDGSAPPHHSNNPLCSLWPVLLRYRSLTRKAEEQRDEGEAQKIQVPSRVPVSA